MIYIHYCFVEKIQNYQVMFEDAFAEPEGSHTIDGVWTCSYKTFWAMKNCCYIVLSVLCGGPCACVWGLVFACQSFYNIWLVEPILYIATFWTYNRIDSFFSSNRCFRPCMTSWYIDFKCCFECYRKCVECQLNPCYDAMARMFSKIKFHHRYEVV